MFELSKSYIKENVADSVLIYNRGRNIYEHGSYFLSGKSGDNTTFYYEVDGNYGNYQTHITLKRDKVLYLCTCPYPGNGCKHVVAALLHVKETLSKTCEVQPDGSAGKGEPYLSGEEIKAQALDDRKKRATSEPFSVIRGDMLKGDHLVINKTHREYSVTLHDPQKGHGHCTCPDYMTGGLNTCKHILFLCSHLKKERGFKKALAKESFPFVDIFWDSASGAPRLYAEDLKGKMPDLKPVLDDYFTDQGRYKPKDTRSFMSLQKTALKKKSWQASS
ncbi:MAG: SWIM zinc finger family protein [Desulfobacterales bacterium]|nr:SWIM zinc finger family protein [Desulfobacterales bacterium]